MDMETLIKQYDNTLTQYTQLNSEYLTYIKNTNIENLPKDLISVSNSEYSGTETNVISEIHTADVEACKASCSSTSGCSGATFNVSPDNNCSLKSGDGKINIKANYSAIVTKKMDYLNRLKSLNDQLTSANTNITNYISNNKPDLTSKLSENQSVLNGLSNDLAFLVDKKDDIDTQIRSITELDGKIDQSSILVNKNYSIFNILLIVAILAIVIFCYMFIFSSDNNDSNNLGNGSNNLDNGINDNGSNSVFGNLVFLIILFICGFLAWINKTTIENWFKKNIYNSSYLI
jgi:hypothetical protein